MKTREQRYNELYSSGLVDAIKTICANRSDISEDYYVLMADYIDSMDQIKDEMLINPTEIARRMPELIKGIQERNLGGIYGRTDDGMITMEQSLSYNDKKLYFFHELTHALQTHQENGIEECGFYDGHDGMFLTEGATQYTAEMLYNVSNGTNLQHREQNGTVRGAGDRRPYSPLSEYQYNGNVLELLAKSMDLPLPQVLALAYKRNGRDILKEIYESMDGNQGKFDELMNNLEQIYSIDNLIIHGYSGQLQSQTPLNITMQDGVTTFKGNLNIYRELMNKTERELVATYIENHDVEQISQNYNEIAQFLTTPEIKRDFLSIVQQLNPELSQNNIVNINDSRRTETADTQSRVRKGFKINEYGELIRTDDVQDIPQMDNIPIFTPPTNAKTNDNKLSLKQKIAQFLQKNNLFMNLSFVENFVHQQLDILPEASQLIKTETHTVNSTRENFMNELTNFGAYRNLPPIQRMSDPQKMEEMRKKMEQYQQENNGGER